MNSLASLLATIGQSLGKGLSQVGQVELAKQANLEQIREESKQRLANTLFQELTKASSSEGIRALTDDERQKLTKAVVSLGAGKYDDAVINDAVGLLGRISFEQGRINTIRNLFSRGDFDQLGALLEGVDDETASRLLTAAGLEATASGLRSLGGLYRAAKEAGVALTQAQAQNIVAATNRINTLLKFELERAALENKKLQNEVDVLERTTEARIRSIILDAQAKEIGVETLRDRINAEIREILSRALQNEQRANEIAQKLGPEIGKILADTKLVEAETKRAEAVAQYYAVQAADVKSDTERKRVDFVSKLVLEAPSAMESQDVVDLLMGGEGGIKDEDRAQRIANGILEAAKRKKRIDDLTLLDREMAVIEKIMANAGSYGDKDTEGALRIVIQRALGDDAPKEVVDAFVAKAKFLGTLQMQGGLNRLYETYAQRVPASPEQHNQAAKEAYEAVLSTCGGMSNPACVNRANAFVGALKATWLYATRLREAELGEKTADVMHKRALATYYEAMAKAKPQEIAIDWERVKQGWANIELQRKEVDLREKELNAKLEAAKAAGINIDAVKKMADMYRDAVDGFNNVIANELYARGQSGCANAIIKKGAIVSLESAITGLSKECQEQIRNIFNDPNWNQVKEHYAMMVTLGNALSATFGVLGGGGGEGRGAGTPGGATPAPQPQGTGRQTATPTPQGTQAPATPPLLAAQGQAKQYIRPGSVPQGFSDTGTGYAALVAPVEGGFGSGNPLQLIHQSYSGIKTECEKRYGNDPARLALCQGEGLARRLNINPSTPAWYAALNHFLPEALKNPNEPIRKEYADANPVFQRFSGKELPTGRDVAAAYIYYHLDTYRDTWTKRVPDARPAFDNPANLRELSYILANLPNKTGQYTAADVVAAARAAGLGNVNQNPALVNALVKMANEMRVGNIGRVIRGSK